MKIRHVSFGISTNLPAKFGILFVTASVNKIRSAVIGGMEAKKSVQEPGVPLDRLISFATRRERYFTFFSSPLLTSTHLVGMIFSFVGRSIISHTCIWFITLISSDRASSTFSVKSGFPEILSQYWGASASIPKPSSHTGRTVVVSVCNAPRKPLRWAGSKFVTSVSISSSSSALLFVPRASSETSGTNRGSSGASSARRLTPDPLALIEGLISGASILCFFSGSDLKSSSFFLAISILFLPYSVSCSLCTILVRQSSSWGIPCRSRPWRMNAQALHPAEYPNRSKSSCRRYTRLKCAL